MGNLSINNLNIGLLMVRATIQLCMSNQTVSCSWILKLFGHILAYFSIFWPDPTLKQTISGGPNPPADGAHADLLNLDELNRSAVRRLHCHWYRVARGHTTASQILVIHDGSHRAIPPRSWCYKNLKLRGPVGLLRFLDLPQSWAVTRACKGRFRFGPFGL